MATTAGLSHLVTLKNVTASLATNPPGVYDTGVIKGKTHESIPPGFCVLLWCRLRWRMVCDQPGHPCDSRGAARDPRRVVRRWGA